MRPGPEGGARVVGRLREMPEADLRAAVERLVEQTLKEQAFPEPSGRYLWASEILWLLGLGPHPQAAGLKALDALVNNEGGTQA